MKLPAPRPVERTDVGMEPFMPNMIFAAFLALLPSVLAGQPQATDSKAQPAATSPAPEGKPKSITEALKREATLLTPMVRSDLAKVFLAAVDRLPEPLPRTVYRNREKGTAVSAAEWNKLSDADRAAFKPRECPPSFYYLTGYGSPLVYVRVVDLMAQHGLASLKQARVLDFGYGTIGHLRLMSEQGAEAHGVDVEPLLAALYSEPGDTSGTLKIHTGQWPAEPELAKAIGTGFDVITSKNTLKAGYIHPKPPQGKTVDEKLLVKLGVEDATFLKTTHDALKPGGLFIIYNIGPAQSPAEDLSKPYMPWADAKSPFTREQLEAAGFEVLAFDTDDQPWILDCWKALGYDQGKPREEAAKETFAWYTVARRRK